MNKIYVFVTYEWPSSDQRTIDLSGVALAEDGDVLAGHISSSESYLQGDLGVTTKNHHDKYKAHYTDGYEVEYVPMDKREAHEGLRAAIEANHAKMAQAEKEAVES